MAPRTLTDNAGRGYAALDELRDGQRIEFDTGFDCLNHEADRPTTRTVLTDERGKLYVVCKDGRHYLEGQLGEDRRSLIGVYCIQNGCGCHTD
jgi:hypothetical protein